MSVAVSKADTAAALGIDSALKTSIQANLDAVSVDQVDNTVTITVNNAADLISYSITDGGVDAKWIPLAIDTNEANLLDVSLNGVNLTADDVTEANNFGLAADTFVLWVKLDVPNRTIALDTDGKVTTNIVINII